MKTFFEWLEQDASRGRKVVLMGTIFMWMMITVGLFFQPIFMASAVSAGALDYYVVLSGIVASLFAFYTGTSSKKTDAKMDKVMDAVLDEVVKKIEKK